MQAAAIPSGALACLIYTSGTGGAPKGVMLPHRAILSNCRGAFELVRPLRLKDETYLSYLPLSHSYEHTVGQFFLPSIGTEIVYCRGVEHLAADMLTVRPTILTAVPRVLEVIRGRMLAQVARAAAMAASAVPRVRWTSADNAWTDGAVWPSATGCSTRCSTAWSAPRCAPVSAAG